MADSGFRLTVEGEKEFREALKAIDAQIKTSTSELKMLAEQYKISEEPMKSLEARQKSLAEAMDLQAQKSQSIAEEIEKVSATYGENDSFVLKLTQDYNNSQAQLAKLTGEYKETVKIMEDAHGAMERMADMQQTIDDTTEDFAAAVKAAYEQIGVFNGTLGKSDEAMKSSKEKIKELNKTHDDLKDNIKQQNDNIKTLTDNLKKAEKAYGESADETKKYREQLEEAKAALNDMQKAAEENRKAVDKIGENNGGLDGMLDVLGDIGDKLGIKLPGYLSDLVGNVGEVTTGMGLWAGAAGAAFKVVKETNEALKETADKYKDLYTQSQTLGVDTTEYQKLEYALTMVGVESSELEGLFSALNGKIKEADEVIGDYAGSMDQLKYASQEEREAVVEMMNKWNEYGVALYDNEGNLRDTIDIFYDLIDVYDDYTNKTERITKMQDIFGDNAAKLNPIVDAGADSMRHFAEQAEAAGIVMDEVTINRMYEISLATDILAKKTEVLGDKWNIFWHDLLDFSSWGGGNLSRSADALWDSITGLFVKNSYADGTSFAPGGWSLVGERGPEIVHLPRGSQVFPNGVIPDMGAAAESNVYNITISARDVQEFNDIVRIAQGQKQSIRMGFTGR